MSWKNAKGGFIYWLNRFLNPDHPWTTYWDPTTGEDTPDDTLRDDSATYGLGNLQSGSLLGTIGKGVDALVNKWTDASATGGEIERNAMQMQNAEDIYQRQVVGMQKAGLNPALMYGSGVGSSPGVSTSSSAPGLNMSDIMNSLLFKKQSKLLDAQADNINADTDKKKAETENMILVNKFYPDVTDTQIKKMMKDMGLTDAEIEKVNSEVNLNNLEADLKEIQKIINQAEADESSAYFKATRRLQEARTDTEKENARAAAARAFIDELEGKFMDKYGVKMGSSEYIAIASALANLFGVDLDFFSKSPFEGLADLIKEWFKYRKPAGAAYGAGGR